jgi:hypothetical protein
LLAAGDLFLEGFGIGLLLEKEGGDAGDDAGFVPADDGDGGELFYIESEIANFRPNCTN